MMRRLTGEEAAATGLDRNADIMTEPETGDVTFWEQLPGRILKPLFTSRRHEWFAQARLEELRARNNDP